MANRKKIEKFGNWTVLETFSSPRGKYCRCQCICGNEGEVAATSLRAGRSTQCKECAKKTRYGARRHNHEKWIGETFGKLTVISLGEMTREGRMYRCICSCGKQKEYPAAKLKAGKTKQCLSCSNSERSTKHGFHAYPEYKIWTAIKSRCRKLDNKQYKYYGERGIDICQEWFDSFETFIEHIGFRPGKRFTLDRTDNEKGYQPGNVRWVPMLVNANNTRRNVHYEKDGTSYTARDVATKFNIPYHRVNWCLIRYGIDWVFANIETVRQIRKKG